MADPDDVCLMLSETAKKGETEAIEQINQQHTCIGVSSGTDQKDSAESFTNEAIERMSNGIATCGSICGPVESEAMSIYGATAGIAVPVVDVDLSKLQDIDSKVKLEDQAEVGSNHSSSNDVTSEIEEEVVDDTVNHTEATVDGATFAKGSSHEYALFSGKCGICCTDYKEPMLLQCLHTFCKECIMKRKKVKVSKNQAYFVCPVCKIKTNLGVEEEDTLSSEEAIENHMFNRLAQEEKLDKSVQTCTICKLNSIIQSATKVCFECKDFLCSECAEKHKFSRYTIDHEINELDEDSFNTMKSLLVSKEVDVDSEFSVVQERRDFEKLMLGVHDRIKAIGKNIVKDEKYRKKVSKKKASNINLIHNEFNKLFEHLKSEEELAISCLEDQMKKLNDQFKHRKQHLEQMSWQHEESLKIAEQFLQKSSDNEFMSSRNWYRNRLVNQLNCVAGDPLNWNIVPRIQMQTDRIYRYMDDNKLFCLIPTSKQRHPLNIKFETTFADMLAKSGQQAGDKHQFLSGSSEADVSHQIAATNASVENPEFKKDVQVGMSSFQGFFQSQTGSQGLIGQLDSEQLSSKSDSPSIDSLDQNKTPDLRQDGNSLSDGSSHVTSAKTSEETKTKKRKRTKKKKQPLAANSSGKQIDGNANQGLKSAKQAEAARPKVQPPTQAATSKSVKKSQQMPVKQKTPAYQNPNLLNQSDFQRCMQSFLPNKGGLLSSNFPAGMASSPNSQNWMSYAMPHTDMNKLGPMYSVNDVWKPPTPPVVARPLITTPESCTLKPLFRLDIWIKLDTHPPNITGVICIGTGKIAVADYQNNKIKLFSSTGQFLQAYNADHPTSLVFCAGKLIWCSGHSLEIVVMEKNSMEPGISLGNQDLPRPLARGSMTELFIGNGNSILAYDWIKKEKTWKHTCDIVPQYAGKNKKNPTTIMTIARVPKNDGFFISDWKKGTIYSVDSSGKITGSYTEPVKAHIGNPSFIPTGLHYDADRNKLFTLDHQGNRLLMMNPDSCTLQQEWSTLPAIKNPLAVVGNKDRQLFLTGSDQFLHVYQYSFDG